MNWRGPLLDVAARMLRRRGAAEAPCPRLLVIRRNRLGDMICTLPLLHALRGHFPAAHLAAACDAPGAPIAAASGVVDEVILLGSRGVIGQFQSARRLQGFDSVLVAKGGFDRRQATLARLTNGTRRIGFDSNPSLYFTDPVPWADTHREHQIETLFRLLAPLEIAAPVVTNLPPLQLPSSATDFAGSFLDQAPWRNLPRFALVNISSTARLRFREEDFLSLVERMLAVDAGMGILFVAAPNDQSRARDMAGRCRSERVAAAATPGPLEIAALMQRARVLVTPEGGAAHLAAAVGLRAVVIWSEGPLEKWRARAQNHLVVQAGPHEPLVPVERVWQALETLLAQPART